MGKGQTHVVSSVSRNCERIFSNVKTGSFGGDGAVGGPYVPHNHHFYNIDHTIDDAWTPWHNPLDLSKDRRLNLFNTN